MFWIDDDHKNNLSVVKQIEKSAEIIQIFSTDMMKIILEKFFWIYRFLNKKIAIVSDMVRKEDNKINYEAGVDLFQMIYNDFGFSCEGIIYTKDEAKAIQNIKKRNIFSDKWKVLISPDDLIDEIASEFRK